MFEGNAREVMRKTDPVKTARGFVSAPWIYGADSKERTRNPDYHPAVFQTEAGKYVDVDGTPLPLSKVPDYVRQEGRPAPGGRAPERVEMTLADAMKEAMDNGDRKAPVKTQRGRTRGRPRKSG